MAEAKARRTSSVARATQEETTPEVAKVEIDEPTKVIIPNEAAAAQLLRKLELVNIVSLAESKGLVLSQIAAKEDDTVDAIGRKIVKAYLKHRFPTASGVRVLTRSYKVALNARQNAAFNLIYSRGYNTQQYQDICGNPEVGAAFTNLTNAISMTRSIATIGSDGPNHNISFEVANASLVRFGMVRSYLMGIMIAIDTLKDTLDEVVSVLTDIPAQIRTGGAARIAAEAAAAVKARQDMEEIFSDLTGNLYNLTAATETLATVATTATIATPARSAPARDAITVMRPDEYEDDDDDDDDIFEDDEDDGEDDEDDGDGVIEVIPVGPQVARPAAPDLQERLNQILREQGVL